MSFAAPGPLRGPRVLLEPLNDDHREPLRLAAAEDQSIWTYFPINYNGAGEDFDEWFDYTMARRRADEHYPFAVRRRDGDRVVGTTRFYDMVPDHRRLAIGSTWYTPDARGTLINPEVRLLTLTYAFDVLAVNRVELITDPRNLSSRAAMRILGAVEEGVIRRHLIYKDGRVRDSVLFSIISGEWPDVRDRLLGRLGYPADAIAVG
ncbi:GNAT family N-acetyltransferase [Actinoplanes sp. NPDC049599]|uniref:GNAT family N-acetyltransferase n=1 Tax=Actinoplanes sp. NPDC049599 TaxID=3363903 RepID=UPI0037BB0C00